MQGSHALLECNDASCILSCLRIDAMLTLNRTGIEGHFFLKVNTSTGNGKFNYKMFFDVSRKLSLLLSIINTGLRTQ